ncbi:major facilitator superfamily domain-containing protein [Pilobolus umbonatus]|nr:major facilitator superfamily domain-containing protein [Pilobolus umbonatus]
MLTEIQFQSILSTLYFIGFLGGTLIFGWIGFYTNQRRLPIVAGTLLLIIVAGMFFASSKDWILLIAKALNGLSNASTWVMSSMLVLDRWPKSSLSLLIGYISGYCSIGIMVGSVVGGVVIRYTHEPFCYLSSIVLCIVVLSMQFMLLEPVIRSDIQPTGLKIDDLTSNRGIHIIGEHAFKQMGTTKVSDYSKLGSDGNREKQDDGGAWSKNSSMSTISLKDDYGIDVGNKSPVQSIASINNVLSDNHLQASVYQLFILFLTFGALEPTLIMKKYDEANELDVSDYLIRLGSFFIPYSLSCVISGWVCTKIGHKTVGLTSLILCIPVITWMGAPNQSILSISFAYALGGVMMANIQVSMCNDVFYFIPTQADNTISNRNEYVNLKAKVITLTVIVIGVGAFCGSLFTNLMPILPLFWYNTILSMLLLTCIPLMNYYTGESQREACLPRV